jgi:hypothetical protein
MIYTISKRREMEDVDNIRNCDNTCNFILYLFIFHRHYCPIERKKKVKKNLAHFSSKKKLITYSFKVRKSVLKNDNNFLLFFTHFLIFILFLFFSFASGRKEWTKKLKIDCFLRLKDKRREKTVNYGPSINYSHMKREIFKL